MSQKITFEEFKGYATQISVEMRKNSFPTNLIFVNIPQSFIIEAFVFTDNLFSLTLLWHKENITFAIMFYEYIWMYEYNDMLYIFSIQILIW